MASVDELFDDLFNHFANKKEYVETLSDDCFAMEGWFHVEITNLLRKRNIPYLVQALYPATSVEGSTGSGLWCDVLFKLGGMQWLELKAICTRKIIDANKTLVFEDNTGRKAGSASI